MTGLLRPFVVAGWFALVVPLACSWALWPATVGADELGGLKVLGVAVEPADGEYLVLKDVNVRAEPETRSKRVAKLRGGDRVVAVGRVKGPWLAVRSGTKVLGFVFEPILMPLIDGTLNEPIAGETTVAGVGRCAFSIEFVGKSEAGLQRFEFADYGVEWRCRPDGAGNEADSKPALAFHTPMFLSEGPYQGTKSPVHQITVDVLELAGSLEEVFSTHLLWDRRAGKLAFDSATIKKFVHASPPAPQPAKTLPDALKKAVEIAALAWTDLVWAALAKKPQSR